MRLLETGSSLSAVAVRAVRHETSSIHKAAQKSVLVARPLLYEMICQYWCMYVRLVRSVACYKTAMTTMQATQHEVIIW
jgi:hypothetical protein